MKKALIMVAIAAILVAVVMAKPGIIDLGEGMLMAMTILPLPVLANIATVNYKPKPSRD